MTTVFLSLVSIFLFIFYEKEYTAYEMRISDGSSDVGSSDLMGIGAAVLNLAPSLVRWLKHDCNVAAGLYPQCVDSRRFRQMQRGEKRPRCFDGSRYP